MVEYTFVATKSSSCIMNDRGDTIFIAAGNNVTIKGIVMDAMRSGHWVYHILEQIAPPYAKYEVLNELIREFDANTDEVVSTWGPTNG